MKRTAASTASEPPETKKLIGKRPLANPGDEIKRIHESKFPKDDEKDEDEEKGGAQKDEKGVENKNE